MAQLFPNNIIDFKNAWFATVWTADKKPIFRDSTLAQIFHLSLLDLKFSKNFRVYGWVILTDHLHLLFQTRDIVGFFKCLIGELNDFYRTYRENFYPKNLLDKPELIPINSKENFQKHFYNLHLDPVVHGYVDDLIDYPFSSYHEYLKLYGVKFDDYFRKK